MRQTWYETAKRNLKPEERLRFYETCFEFEFYQNSPAEDLPFSSRLLYDMVKDDLESDMARAHERSERARRNGLAGGRPKNTQENTGNNNPEKPTGFAGFTNTIQYNTQQNNTEQSENEDSHTLFLVALDFFERGCSTPVVQAQKFWGYYAGIGWKTKNGAEIVDRLALAKAWQLPDCSAASIKRRAPWVDLLRKSGAVELSLIEDFVDIKRDATRGVLDIRLMNQETAILFDNKYIEKVLQWIPKTPDGKRFEVQYSTFQDHLD